MADSGSVNYASDSGIYKSELPGAIIFAIIYLPLFLYNVIRSIRHTTYVLFVLTLFCLLRVVAFTLRAILSRNESAAHNANVVVAEGIIYSVGFFGLLYSAYTLVLDRESITVGPNGRDTGYGIIRVLSRIIRNRHLIRMALSVAVALGITSGVESSSTDESTLHRSHTFRRVSIYIFLVVACLLVIVTGRLAYEENLQRSQISDVEKGTAGQKYRIVLLLGIAFLCVIREAFFAATSNNTKQANNAHLWYPLSALPELVAVLIFAVPGLVPSRAELAQNLQAKLGYDTEGAQNRGSSRVAGAGIPMFRRSEAGAV